MTEVEGGLSRADFESFIRWSVGCSVAGFVTSERLEALASHPTMGIEQGRTAIFVQDQNRLRSHLRRRCSEAVARFEALGRPVPAGVDVPENLEPPQLLEAMRIWFATSPKSLQSRRRKIGQIGPHVSEATVQRHYEGPMAAFAYRLLREMSIPELDVHAVNVGGGEVAGRSAAGRRTYRTKIGAAASVLGVAVLGVVALVATQFDQGRAGSIENSDDAGDANTRILGPTSNVDLVHCGSINLRSGAEIPTAVKCAAGRLQAEGDLLVGWNGRISAWEIDGPIEARASWENWDDGTPDPSGTNPWTVSGNHSDGDAENDRYQELEIFADSGGRLTIWEKHDRTGFSVTFRYVDDE